MWKYWAKLVKLESICWSEIVTRVIWADVIEEGSKEVICTPPGSALDIINEVRPTTPGMSPSIDDLITQIEQLDSDVFDTSKATSSVSLNYRTSQSSVTNIRSRSQSQVSFGDMTAPVIPTKTAPRRRKSIVNVFAKSKARKSPQ